MSARAWRSRWPVLVGPVVILSLWELLSRTGVLRATFFPPPSQIAARSTIIFDVESGLGGDLRGTLVRLAITIVLATVVGVAIGLAMSISVWLEHGVGTVLAFFYPVPGVLFLPFLAFVLGRGETVVILASLVTPLIVMVLYTMEGVRAIDRVLLEAAKAYGARRWRFFSRVLLPGALPSIVAGLRISLGFTLIAVIAVEMVAAPDGLGNFLWTNWQILRVMDMYVALACIAVLGLLSSVGFDAVANRLLPWRTSPTGSAT